MIKYQNEVNKIFISYHSGIYTLEVEQLIPTSIFRTWDFFSSPGNLSEITPPEMNFTITSGNTEKMYAGQIISYKVNLSKGIKTNWVTEITAVKENSYFIDEQRFGPYKMWHHEHHFQENDEGILMKDKVSYKIPFGFLGRLIHFFVIRRKLVNIFLYRMKILEKIFSVQNKKESFS